MSWLIISAPLLVAGITLLARALNPPGPDLAERFARYEAVESTSIGLQTEVNSILGRRSIEFVRFFEQDRFPRLVADLEIVGEDLEQHALERLGLSIFGGPVVFVFILLTDLSSSPWVLSVAVLLGTIVGYLFPGQQVLSKATQQRIEFDVALRDVISLLLASTRGGAGLNTAIQDAMTVCSAPSMDVVQRDLWDRMLRGDQASAILLETGIRLQLDSLISLGQSLSIASSSGGSVDKSLISRGRVAAEAETMRRLRGAEEEGERMTIFIGVIASGLTAFLLYPSLVALFSAGT